MRAASVDRSDGGAAATAPRWRRPSLSVEALLLAASLLLALFANGPFWRAVLDGRDFGAGSTWGFAAAVLAALVALQFVVLGLVATRRTVRVVLALSIVTSALAAHYMQRYGIVLDPSMLRNVLHTRPQEASELVGAGLVGALALGLAGAALPWAVRIDARRSWPRAALVRAGTIGVALLVAVGALLAVFQDFASVMRNQRGLRYTVTPANIVWSLARVATDDARAATEARDPPEPAHYSAARAPGQRKPTLFVLVVGETVRAANFSLNGYARDTNPELARIGGLVNFPHASACGTSTEVSLPCMFSPFGRADYDEQRIRRHESLLHVLARAGARVAWLDNQTGCKGVCDGLEFHDLASERVPGLCDDGRCHDEILLRGLRQVVSADRDGGDRVVVLHQLGNHGPSYFRRYPSEFARFQPACEHDELRDCTQAEIVNAYDNAILYTDHLLAQAIGFLDGQRERYDVALVYLSDHGESLGEHGLYLHGMPRPIAPREQLEVPMLWWFGGGSAAALGVDVGCLRARAAAEASHDHLYHSVLGLLGVETAGYRRDRDLFDGCRPAQQLAALAGGITPAR